MCWLFDLHRLELVHKSITRCLSPAQDILIWIIGLERSGGNVLLYQIPSTETRREHQKAYSTNSPFVFRLKYKIRVEISLKHYKHTKEVSYTVKDPPPRQVVYQLGKGPKIKYKWRLFPKRGGGVDPKVYIYLNLFFEELKKNQK